MRKKRYATPEQLLRSVILALEHGSARDAVLLLLEQGPLWTPDAYAAERDRKVPERLGHDDDGRPIFEVSVVGGELLAFLRDLVREQDSGSLALGIWLRGVKVRGRSEGGRVALSAEGAMREAAILQLAFLVYTVGVGNVRICSASDCPRLYVKTYRRAFCSNRCQKREQMREYRAQIRERQRRRKLKGAAR